MTIRVATILIDNFSTISSSDSIYNAAQRMKEEQIPDLVVLEEGKPIGVITDYDIVTKGIALERDLKSTIVLDIMVKVEPIDLKTSIEDALWILQKKSIPILPVSFMGNLRGIISVHDCWTVIPPERWKIYK